MPLSSGQTLNNRYRIVNLLGQGGFGAVYRAWDVNMECPRAVKENLDTSPEAQRQFKREAKILGQLTHSNLPHVIDHFIIPNQGQYLVMDFVEGEDLQEMLLRVGGPLPEAQVLGWIGQVCDALEYLHHQTPPIIHRDIKPANIKVTQDGKATLVDFGIAKVYDPKLITTVGARAVTPGFSPPEQYGQGKTDAKSDIYSLGATCYALLTGKMPTDCMDLLTKGGARLSPVKEVNPRLSSQISDAVEGAMQLDSKKRFPTITGFRTALDSTPMVVSGIARTPVQGLQTPTRFGQTATESTNFNVSKPSRRSQRLVIAIGIGLLLISVIICIGIRLVAAVFPTLFDPVTIFLEDPTETSLPATETLLPATRTPILATNTPSFDLTKRAWLGIVGGTLDNVDRLYEEMKVPQGQLGVYVSEVVENSPADIAGLLGSDRTITIEDNEYYVGGDVIIMVDITIIVSMEQLRDLIANNKPGQKITVTYLRNGEIGVVDIVLGEWPADLPLPNLTPTGETNP